MRAFVYRRLFAVLLGLGLPGIGPLAAEAAGIGFRNDLKTAVYIQGASSVNGMIRRGQPILIPPGRSAWDAPLPPGPRQVTVYDAGQPNRVLHRENVPFAGQDQRFSITPGPAGTIQLVPINRGKRR